MKRLLVLFLIGFALCPLLFAQQLIADTGQMGTYLNSPAGKQLLQSDEGRRLAQQYGREEAVTQTGSSLPGNNGTSAEAKTQRSQKQPLSSIELIVSRDLRFQGKDPILQFGYDLFQTQFNFYLPPESVAAGGDYIVGPGDSFKITMWGISEGVFSVQVNQEGDIVLPKIGVVSVAGLSFAELKPYVEKELRTYYEGVNVSISIDKLRSNQVFVVGEVNNPGAYTLSSMSTAYNALFAAGGVTKKGSLRKIQVLRGGFVIATLDLYKFLLKGDKSQDRMLQSGDTVFVPLIGPVAGIAGQVYRPGIYELNGATDLNDLIDFGGGFLPYSYLNRVQVKRIIAHKENITRDENVTADRLGKKFGLNMMNMDLVEVFPIFEKLNNVVYVEGEVRYPGNYEYKEGMTIKDVLPNKASFIPFTYYPHVEVVRIDDDSIDTKIIPVDINKLYAGDQKENIKLQPLDKVFISANTKKEGKISLKGEVLRPGNYTFVPGEKLSSVLERAGGFTADAYLFGAKFSRRSVKEVQSAKLTQIIENIEQEIIMKEAELKSGSIGDAEQKSRSAQLERSKKLLEMTKNDISEGRVILHLSYPLSVFKNSKDDINLENGDELNIPTVSNVVIVAGEVYTPSAVSFQKGGKASYYLHQVGGMTKNAERNNLYVIRADGSVVSQEQGYNVSSIELLPGDVIVVPQVVERFDGWAATRDITKWLYEAVMAWALIYNVVN